ncbi:Aste57867_7385 [Aphanomyces stellatus]|uniref:Aste57867_4668 protein n=1 Tax=Aphanomyces stellatus TaxID=120398 RepID=A0A485KC48_9STRA|nr:hypothetical protein As57867_007359 [Aphanomyces stellatus]KAF0712802.1 hypothetical protein As57867_004655 [Aphanomyces stellatus]VFT81771.1 Aste57867_4668 [Aphanomyces stellatus]VFT84301.1 Aste57867_7385 [Aphanomyces stellatus]
MKTTTILLSALAVTTASLFKGVHLRDVEQSQCGEMREYVDYPGNDIGSVSATRYDQCCSACASDSRCTLVVWNSKDQKCYKKNAKSSPVYLEGAETYFMSGRTSSTSGTQCGSLNTNSDYTGNDIKNGYANTVGECCTMCRNDSRCKIAVFNSNERKCYLKSAKGTWSFLAGATTIDM